MPTFQPNDVIPVAFLNAIPRENLELEEVTLVFPLTALRYHDGTAPVTTASAGKPAIVTGSWDTPQGYFQGEDAQSDTRTEYLLGEWRIPAEWSTDLVFGVAVRANDAGNNTLQTASVDLRAWRRDVNGEIGANIITTAAQTFTKSWAVYEFDANTATLASGEVLRFMVRTELRGSGGGVLKCETRLVRIRVKVHG